MWNGAPSLGIDAIDGSGAVRWSAMMPGAPAKVPGAVRAALGGIEKELADKE